MPFMIGISPVRRTTKYLKSGKIILRENVKIFSINYNVKGNHHKGARDFVFWHLPQVQYKNPNVQCLTFMNLTPSPFIRIFFENTKDVLIDIDSREKDEIVNHLVNFTAICKSPKELKENCEKNIDLTYFGYGCKRHCICEVIGQVPCPRLITLPDHWRGKNRPLFKNKFTLPPCYMIKGLEEPEEEG